mmetsp:Transcript_49043/g.123370  ORF Transcript_49043/g.123370 Transcript_49043/m.123370 type:complete len:256 (+) Transcript_49043:123-890(+)
MLSENKIFGGVPGIHLHTVDGCRNLENDCGGGAVELRSGSVAGLHQRRVAADGEAVGWLTRRLGAQDTHGVGHVLFQLHAEIDGNIPCERGLVVPCAQRQQAAALGVHQHLLVQEVPDALHKRALHLADVDSGVQRHARIVHNVRPQDLPLTGEDVQADLRHSRAICVVCEGAVGRWLGVGPAHCRQLAARLHGVCHKRLPVLGCDARVRVRLEKGKVRWLECGVELLARVDGGNAAQVGRDGAARGERVGHLVC